MGPGSCGPLYPICPRSLSSGSWRYGGPFGADPGKDGGDFLPTFPTLRVPRPPSVSFQLPHRLTLAVLYQNVNRS